MYSAKKRLAAITAVLLGLAVLFLPGQGFSAEVKIGFVSIQQVLFNCKQGADAGKQLKEKKDAIMAELGKISDEGKALQAEIAKKQSVWSQDKLTEKQRELEKLGREMRLKQEDAKADIDQLQKKLINPLLQKLDPILKEYGKVNGYTVIIDADVAARSGMVVYGEPSLDISKELIKKMDQ